MTPSSSAHASKASASSSSMETSTFLHGRGTGPGVDGIIHRHSVGGIYRDDLNRWYVPYGIDASCAMPDLLAMGRALARSARVRDAGLEAYWDEPGYPPERL